MINDDDTATVLLDYPHRMGGHCGSGALRDLLDWAGLGWNGPPGEGLTFGLGGGLAFHYLQLPGHPASTYIVGRTADLELDLCTRLGIDVERRQTDDAALGWQWVQDELDAGRPVMVWADIAALPYLRVQLSNTRHDIVVIGYDESAEVAYIVDNDREQVQRVSLSTLAAARSTSGFPDQGRQTTFLMRFPSELPDLHQVARDAAAASVQAMRNGSDGLDGLPLPPGFTHAGGLDGLDRFAHDVAAWPDSLTDGQWSQAAATLAVLIDKAGTGGGLFRRLQATFCDQVARETGSRAFADAGRRYAACDRAWSQLAEACRQTPTDRAAVASHAARLPALERAAVHALDRAATSPPDGTGRAESNACTDDDRRT